MDIAFQALFLTTGSGNFCCEDPRSLINMSKEVPSKGSGAATDEAEIAAPQAVEKPAAPGLPPDGGLRAWLQVVGGFFFVFNTW